MGHPRFLYLHGFASGPTSRKAQFFRERFAEAGYVLEVPDLSEGNFEQLTVGGQLRFLERLLEGEAATLIGSSLGGYLAALYASRHPEVSRLVLLAPAFGFAERWPSLVGEAGMKQWRETGRIVVYHHGERRERELGFDFYQESQQWPPFPGFPQPAQLFHGIRDTVVPLQASEQFAAQHPNALLITLPSDHELTDVLPEIWQHGASFLLPS